MARGKTDKKTENRSIRRRKCEPDSDSEESLGSSDTYSEDDEWSTEDEEDEESSETESSEEDDSEEDDSEEDEPKKDISEKKIRKIFFFEKKFFLDALKKIFSGGRGPPKWIVLLLELNSASFDMHISKSKNLLFLARKKFWGGRGPPEWIVPPLEFSPASIHNRTSKMKKKSFPHFVTEFLSKIAHFPYLASLLGIH